METKRQNKTVDLATRVLIEARRVHRLSGGREILFVCDEAERRMEKAREIQKRRKERAKRWLQDLL